MKTSIKKVIICLCALQIISESYGQTNPFGVASSKGVKKVQKFPSWVSGAYATTVNGLIRATATRTNVATSPGSSNNYHKITLVKGGLPKINSNLEISAGQRTSSQATCLTYTHDNNINDDRYTQPVFNNNVNAIYPGYIISTNQFMGNEFPVTGVPQGYSRRPYQLSVNFYGGTVNSASIGSNGDYSKAAYDNALNTIIRSMPNGSLPFQGFKFDYIYFNTKEELSAKLGFGVSADIPPEVMALITTAVAGVPIPVAANVDINASTSAQTITQKTRILLKISVDYFDVTVSPPNNQEIGDNNSKPIYFLKSSTNTAIPTNLVYASTVSYGMMGYVLFESDMSESELQSTLNAAIGVEGALGEGEIGAHVNAESKAKFSSQQITMKGWGRGLNLTTPTTISSYESLISLLATVRPFTKQNYGAITGFTMNFVSESGEQAMINHFSDFSYKKCSKPPAEDLIYDLKLKLADFTVKKVGDIGGFEDFHGNIVFTYALAGDKSKNTDISMWQVSNAEAHNKANFNVGTFTTVAKELVLFENLTYNEITNLKIYVRARLYDDESIGASNKFHCFNCEEGPDDNDYYKRKVEWNVNSKNFVDALNKLNMNGPYSSVKLDSNDNYFEMVMYENNNKNNGETRIRFQLWVKAK